MVSSQQEIFIEEQHYLPTIEAQIKYLSSKQNEDEYLSQFIYSSGSQNLQQNWIVKSDQPINTYLQSGMNRSYSSQRDVQSPAKNNKRERSYFHNFQKQLVITLRNMIKLQKHAKKEQNQYIACQMWEVFVRSSLYNKKFLYVLFGVHGNSDQNQFSKNFLNELGYMQIFAKYSEDRIRQTQKFLRKQIIKQFQDIDLKEYLVYRKLKRVNQFQKYIKQFLEEIKQGCVRKRLPKHRKLTMIVLTQDQQSPPGPVN